MILGLALFLLGVVEADSVFGESKLDVVLVSVPGETFLTFS